MTSRPNRLLNKMPNKREEWKYNMGKNIYISEALSLLPRVTRQITENLFQHEPSKIVRTR